MSSEYNLVINNLIYFHYVILLKLFLIFSGTLLYYTRPPSKDPSETPVSSEQETKFNDEDMTTKINKGLSHCRDRARTLYFDMTDS